MVRSPGSPRNQVRWSDVFNGVTRFLSLHHHYFLVPDTNQNELEETFINKRIIFKTPSVTQEVVICLQQCPVFSHHRNSAAAQRK